MSSVAALVAATVVPTVAAGATTAGFARARAIALMKGRRSRSIVSSVAAVAPAATTATARVAWAVVGPATVTAAIAPAAAPVVTIAGYAVVMEHGAREDTGERAASHTSPQRSSATGTFSAAGLSNGRSSYQ